MRISIIVPVYNKQKYLNTILHMIHSQSFVDFECLLIDDGSTDGSGDICDRVASYDSRFKVYHINNSGVSHARNIGLDNAQGEYITFIDSDDEIHQDYLLNLYDCIINYNVDIVISGYTKKWDENDRENEPVFYDLSGKYKMEDLLFDFALMQSKYGIFGWCWSKIFHRELIKNVRFDEMVSLAEDLDFYLRLYPKIDTVYIDNKPYYFYRQETDNSLISSIADDKIDYFTQLKIQIRIRDYLDSENVLVGSNLEISNKRIDDYLFFCLYHSKGKDFKILLAKLQSICIPNTGKHRFGLKWRDWVLYNYWNNNYFLLNLSKKIYDRIRMLRNRNNAIKT